MTDCVKIIRRDFPHVGERELKDQKVAAAADPQGTVDRRNRHCHYHSYGRRQNQRSVGSCHAHLGAHAT